MSTKTKLIHSQRTRSTQGGFQKLTMSLPCQHLSNLPVADLLFSSPCMSSDLIELDPFSGAKEIPLEYNCPRCRHKRNIEHTIFKKAGQNRLWLQQTFRLHDASTYPNLTLALFVSAPTQNYHPVTHSSCVHPQTLSGPGRTRASSSLPPYVRLQMALHN